MDGQPPICLRCGKRHPPIWWHEGDCTQCYERPAMVLNGRTALFCQVCHDAIDAHMKAPLPPDTEQESRQLFERLGA